MKFCRLFEQNDNAFISSALVGHIDEKYSTLVATFGEPNAPGDDYKVDAEWNLLTPDGLATIYNYKDGKNYMGEEGLAVEDITDWHIGGNRGEVVKWIIREIEGR
jgi:hypothetical protein